MHARWLVDTAAILAYHHTQLVETRQPLPHHAMYRYWTLSRQRFNSWHAALHDCRLQLDLTTGESRDFIWNYFQPVMQEIFLSDVLVRVLCAVSASLESLTIDTNSAAISSSVFVGQEEARNRCLHLMTDAIGVPVHRIARLNRIRFALENWTDTLLLSIDSQNDCSTYYFHKKSPDKGVASVDDAMSAQRRRLRWQFLVSGCQQWIDKHCFVESPNSELNQDIHASIGQMMQPQWMDELHLTDDLKPHRMERVLMSLQSLVDSSLAG